MSHRTYACTNFELQSGAVLPECRLIYKVHGTLNAAKDNAILFPTWFCVHHPELEWIIGPGRALDPQQYCIIAVNILGNGMSSSPSNTPAPFDRGRFPRTTVLDNVRLQERMLREVFGIERLALIVGRSMGAQVAFQWGAYFPQMVARMLAIAGSARTSPHNYIFLATVKGAIENDPAFLGGEYQAQPEAGLRQMRLIYDSWVVSQTYYRQNLHLKAGYPTTQAYLDRPFAGVPRDANNVLAQIHTWQNADLSANERFNGDFAAALRAITARAIVMPSRTDLYFPPEDSEIEVAHMPNAELRVLPSIWGHRAGAPGGDPADIAFIDGAIADLLQYPVAKAG
jgi:homoserine O-acetyltransferase/O-succinyltransferase